MDFLTSRLNRLIINVTKSIDTTTLHLAVRCEDKNVILKVLSGVSREVLKVPDQYGNTVLHLVLTNTNLAKNEIIELLGIFLDKGIDIYKENHQGKTVLHRAIQCRMKSVVDFLISRKVDINKCDCEGNSLTHMFIEDETKWFYESFESRKSRYQKIDSVGVEDGHEIVHMAIESDRVAQEHESASFAEFLIEKGFDFDLQNNSGMSALHLAGKHNLIHILHVLVKHTRDIHFVDYQKRSLLELFIETRAAYRDKRKHLTRDWYPEYASRYSANIVRILLDRGVPTWPHDDDRRCTLVRMAIRSEEDTSIVKLLIDHSWKSMEKYSATEIFAELVRIFLWWDESKTEDFWPALEALIARGADVNAKDESGKTPMYHAFYEMNIWAARFFYGRQADFNETVFHALARVEPTDPTAGIDNEKPLHLPVRFGNPPIARESIERCADVNCKDLKGRTPPNHTVYHKRFEEMTEILLKRVAHINGKGKNGRRPLSIAVGLSKANELVPWLLKRGAYVNAGLPFWKSIANSEFLVAEELLAYGADIDNNDADVRSIFNIDAVLRSLFNRPYLNVVAAPSWRDCLNLKKKPFLLRHWIKLSVAKLPCSKEYEAHVQTAECQEIYEGCLKEIETLKCTFIDSRTSIYRFLHMDFGRRRSHVNSEKMQQLVQLPELKQQFPNYAVVILASYRETVMWKSLLEPAKLAWFKITGFPLPGECLELIFAHLRNEDLINMIESEKDV